MHSTNITRRSLRLVLAVLGLVGLPAGLASCFAPDYPANPFWCTEAEPLCPAGYTCDLSSAPDSANPDHRLCKKPGGGQTGKCLDSDLEPNDTPQTATNMDSSLQSHPQGVSLYGVEICTPEDIDYYSFTLTAQKHVTIMVQYTRDQGELIADLLDQNTTTVATGAPVGGGLQIDATVQAGLYYLRVAAGPGGSINKYDFSLTISNPS